MSAPFPDFRLQSIPRWVRLCLWFRPVTYSMDPASGVFVGLKRWRGVVYVVSESKS